MPIRPRARRTAAALCPWPPPRTRRRTARKIGHRTGPAPRPAASYRGESTQQMVAQPAGAAVRNVAGAHVHAEPQRGLDRHAGDERCRDRGAEHVPAAGGIAPPSLRGRRHVGRDPRAADRPAGEIRGPARAQRDDQRLAAARQRTRSHDQGIGAELRHLVLVQLDGVETAEPVGDVRQRLRHPGSIGFLPEKQAVHVGVDEPRESPPQQPCGFQVHFVAGDEIHVQRVQITHLGAEFGPRPGRDAARHLLAAALELVVAQRDPVVGRRDLEEPRPGSHVVQGGEEVVRARREVAADLHEWDDLPVVAQRGVERGERVRDAAPLLDGGLGGIPAVDGVPHHRADDAQALQIRPQVCLMNTAAAPYTPAVPVSSPGTMRHTSTAALNARRSTSARNGSNRRSPARVTPPQITTTSGLKMLMMLATPAPRNLAVSLTTSRAYSSPSCAASYTTWAVIFERSPRTYSGRDVWVPGRIPSIARAAMAGPDA